MSGGTILLSCPSNYLSIMTNTHEKDAVGEKKIIQEMQMCTFCSPGFDRGTVLAHNIDSHVFVFRDGYTDSTEKHTSFLNESVGNEKHIEKCRKSLSLIENRDSPPLPAALKEAMSNNKII